MQREVDISSIPTDVQEVRIVSIGDFDTRPCRDPHVLNTREIGKLKILKLKKAGKDRYRFTFTVVP
ncbi:MAG: alanine-tRNA synthetase second additional domain-containing protein [Candidatus Woesearchaeota archaeon]